MTQGQYRNSRGRSGFCGWDQEKEHSQGDQEAQQGPGVLFLQAFPAFTDTHVYLHQLPSFSRTHGS